METSSKDPDVTSRIANWAASLLASSFVLAVAVIGIAFWMANSAAWVRANPLGALVMAFVLTGYVVAFICLSRLQKGRVPNPLRTWAISLLAACIPLAGLVYMFEGNTAALIIGMAEVGSVLLHLVAIAVLLARASPPNKSLERTREG